MTERLRKRGYLNLFIEWSGKIRAIGHPPIGDWQVFVDQSLRIDGRSIAPIALKNTAIATTADSAEKNWTLTDIDGRKRAYFHIIDPLQAQPMEKTQFSIASVTVIAPTCTLANALAAAAMVFETRKDAESWAQEVVELYPEVVLDSCL